MAEADNDRISIWNNARDESDRSMQPIPHSPEARFYREMTMFADASHATFSPQSFAAVCERIDIARGAAIRAADRPGVTPDELSTKLTGIKAGVYIYIYGRIHREVQNG